MDDAPGVVVRDKRNGQTSTSVEEAESLTEPSDGVEELVMKLAVKKDVREHL